MKLWLVRHGMTRLSEEGRYQGALDEGLSDRGREALAEAPFSPARVYVSPALRARETISVSPSARRPSQKSRSYSRGYILPACEAVPAAYEKLSVSGVQVSGSARSSQKERNP